MKAASKKSATTLTPRRQAFVREYLIDHNGTQAAIRAGYSKRTANEQAAFLLAIPSVKLAVQAGEAKNLDKAEMTADQWRTEVAQMARDTDTPQAVRARCYEMYGKHLGLLVDRQETKHSGSVGVVALTAEDVVRMSDDQLRVAKALIAAVRGEGGDS